MLPGKQNPSGPSRPIDGPSLRPTIGPHIGPSLIPPKTSPIEPKTKQSPQETLKEHRPGEDFFAKQNKQGGAQDTSIFHGGELSRQSKFGRLNPLLKDTIGGLEKIYQKTLNKAGGELRSEEASDIIRRKYGVEITETDFRKRYKQIREIAKKIEKDVEREGFFKGPLSGGRGYGFDKPEAEELEKRIGVNRPRRQSKLTKDWEAGDMKKYYEDKKLLNLYKELF